MALKYIVQGIDQYVCYGLSSDEKPTSPPDYCLFHKTDTNNVYTAVSGVWALPTAHKTMFAIVTIQPPAPVDGESWLLQTAGSGGGQYMGFGCVTTVNQVQYKLQIKTANGIKETTLTNAT